MTLPQTPVQLYRYLLRVVKKLPKDSQFYYKNYVRQASCVIKFSTNRLTFLSSADFA